MPLKSALRVIRVSENGRIRKKKKWKWQTSIDYIRLPLSLSL